jgi:TolB-like protein
LRYLFEDYALDTDRRELRRGADVLAVTPQAFDLLHYLIRNRERVVSKDDLIAAIWNGRVVSDSALTTRLNVARSAIGDSGEGQRLIRTLARKGLRFVGAVREESGPESTVVADICSKPAGAALVPPGRPSIAVLSFAHGSADPSEGFFGDAIAEGVLAELSKLRWLLVVACNSSFAVREGAAEVRQVSRELGVRYFLEGSVLRAADRVRITARLIDATTGEHLWAQRYDRNLTDIFAVH